MRQKNQNGFSIIEIVITMFIIGIVLVIYAGASNAVVLNSNARNKELAQRIAQMQMEQLRATAYNSLPSSGNFTHSQLSQLPNSQATMTISPYNTYTKQITVTVTWKEPGAAAAQTVSFTTLKTRNGL